MPALPGPPESADLRAALSFPVLPGCYPGRAGGLWLCRTLVLSGFHAVVVPSGFRTSVQPHRWITTWWWKKQSEHAVFGAGLAAVGLVLDVVDLAGRGGLAAPPGPLAVLVAQDDRVADRGRDRLGEADVQRQARPAQPGAELPAPQERREPARAGQQVDGLADDRLLDGFPGPGAVRGGRALAAVAVRRRCRRRGRSLPWWRSRSSSTHSRTRSSRAAGFTSPVTNGAIAASQAMRLGGVAVQPRAAVTAAGRGLRPGARPTAPGPGGSTPPAAPSCRPAPSGPPARCAPRL